MKINKTDNGKWMKWKRNKWKQKVYNHNYTWQIRDLIQKTKNKKREYSIERKKENYEIKKETQNVNRKLHTQASSGLTG
jgi:hypothetical protein